MSSKTDLKTALKQAQQEGRAILAANFYNLETLQGIAQAAAQTGSPLILQVTRGSIEYMGLNTVVSLARSVMYEYGLQAWLHLDHGDSVDLVRRCLDAGFDSVMIDASERAFEENVAMTRHAVEMARAYGATVEAELGYVAKLGQKERADVFTRPEQARAFVEATGTDALAVAIGSAHGFYRQEPQLDLQRLERIRQAVDVPLVLHGGSGIPADPLRAAIERGICKINVATETKNAFMRSLKETLLHSDEIDLRKVFPGAREAVRDLILEKLRIVQGGE